MHKVYKLHDAKSGKLLYTSTKTSWGTVHTLLMYLKLIIWLFFAKKRYNCHIAYFLNVCGLLANLPAHFIGSPNCDKTTWSGILLIGEIKGLPHSECELESQTSQWRWQKGRFWAPTKSLGKPRSELEKPPRGKRGVENTIWIVLPSVPSAFGNR